MTTRWRGITAPACELAFWLALAAITFALTFAFADEVGSYRWGAASWPRGVVLAMAVGAVAQFLLRLRARAGSGFDPAASLRLLRAAGSRENLRLAAALGLPLLYVFLLPWTGFYATTPAFLMAYLYCLGERRGRPLIVVPVVVYGLIILVFGSLFYVALTRAKERLIWRCHFSALLNQLSGGKIAGNLRFNVRNKRGRSIIHHNLFSKDIDPIPDFVSTNLRFDLQGGQPHWSAAPDTICHPY